MPLLLVCSFVVIASVLFAQIAAGDVFQMLLDESDARASGTPDTNPSQRP